MSDQPAYTVADLHDGIIAAGERPECAHERSMKRSRIDTRCDACDVEAALVKVAPAIAARAKAEALRELIDRLNKADRSLMSLMQTERIDGKGQGVRLARSYAGEHLREIEAGL